MTMQKTPEHEEGNTYYNNGDFDEALYYYTLALDKDPNNAGLNYNIARCLVKCEDYLRAIHFFRKTFEHTTGNEEWCLYARVNKALTTLELLSNHADQVSGESYKKLLGETLEDLHHMKAEEFEKIENPNPSLLKLVLCGYHLRFLNCLYEALNICSTILQVENSSTTTQYRALRERSYMYALQNNSDGALRDIEEMIRIGKKEELIGHLKGCKCKGHEILQDLINTSQSNPIPEILQQ